MFVRLDYEGLCGFSFWVLWKIYILSKLVRGGVIEASQTISPLFSFFFFPSSFFLLSPSLYGTDTGASLFFTHGFFIHHHSDYPGIKQKNYLLSGG